MAKYSILLALLIGFGLLRPAHAQNTGAPLTFDDLAAWQRISEKTISADGHRVAATLEPWVGDPAVELYDRHGHRTARFEPARGPHFTASGRFLIVTGLPRTATTDSLKRKKTPATKWPKNKLLIYDTRTGHTTVVDSLKSYRLSEQGDRIAYQRGSKDSVLYLLEAGGSLRATFPAVTHYLFAKEGNRLVYASRPGKQQAAVCAVDPENGRCTELFAGSGTVKHLAVSRPGDQVAFIIENRADSTAEARYSLWLATNGQAAQEIAADGHPAFPDGWIVQPQTAPFFSDNGTRLFFATSPSPVPGDTTVIAEYVPGVHIWHWQEEKQYTRQLVEKKKDEERGYAAVYTPATGKVVQLAGETLPDLTLVRTGDALFALVSTSRPYALESMWEGSLQHDVYTIDLETGEKERMKKALPAVPRVSPEGKYAYWYAPADSAWHLYSFAARRESRLEGPDAFKPYNEENDVPDFPRPYGAAGWTEHDRYLLLYDRYDIWRFDPEGREKPVNLTADGRTRKKTYRWLRLDNEQKWIDTGKPQLLSVFDCAGKGSGYASARLAKASAPEILLEGDFRLSAPLKARQAETVLYTAETFERYPDLLLSDLRFRKPVRLTDGGAQQAGKRWGTAEPVRWMSLDSVLLEGIVYKPAGFDPSKKYPMIVNFYERNADNLYAYRMPEPNRSTIDYHFYTSNGYVVFNPDVRYRTGHPGQSAYDCIVPGIRMLAEKGYIDTTRIGAQGHSWGGYQVAELATRTGLFVAIESGAPVVNMFSAYGGIRWDSGLNRSFQYEHGQSRIGRTPWEAPGLYRENSPLFRMDRVNTPILIMANDRDGHVPWYQGIEFFIALKRLGKPVWLLNYTGEPHWPMRMANRIDFQKRMYQFFEHYLNSRPMPRWMKEGVPATRQGTDLGYE